LVEEFQTVSSFARTPVKITMTGPHLLAAVAYDEYYNDTIRMIGDFGKLLHQNFRRLADAGCKHLQIDEPYFTVANDQEVRAAVDAINMAVDGLPDDVHVMVHICQGNYAVGPDYDGQIGHRYFDQGRYKADLVCEIECDGFLIESPECRDRTASGGADQSAWMARARTNNHHQLLRLQSSSAAHRAWQNAGND
jgi:5-methyltetrahydropteroyltriglutamate--homocysteine methyltransferase